MATANASLYRPDPDRSISVVGEFTDDLAAQILPQVLKCRHESDAPITVYIHGPGGQVSILEAVDTALRTPGIDGNTSRIISVGVGDCSSAAASLLVLGNYTHASPEATLHFHGTRISEVQVTVETAQNVVAQLNRINRRVARRIAESILPRVMFRYFQLRDGFRLPKNTTPGAGDLLVHFQQAISSKIGYVAGRLLDRTCTRVQEAMLLTTKVFAKVNINTASSPKAADARVLRALLKHEISNAKGKGWRLDEAGMNRLVEDYFMLRDFHWCHSHSYFRQALTVYGPEFLTASEREEYQTIKNSDQKKALEFLFKNAYFHVGMFWFFTITLSDNLFVGENPIPTRDAYWIGLIDEISGSRLPCERAVAEDQSKKAKPSPSSA